jgi:hypothetical protein
MVRPQPLGHPCHPPSAAALTVPGSQPPLAHSRQCVDTSWWDTLGLGGCGCARRFLFFLLELVLFRLFPHAPPPQGFLLSDLVSTRHEWLVHKSNLIHHCIGIVLVYFGMTAIPKELDRVIGPIVFLECSTIFLDLMYAHGLPAPDTHPSPLSTLPSPPLSTPCLPYPLV